MIKNIIFDIDGVLTDLNRCYFNFFKNTYDQFKNLKFEDMPELCPLSSEDGAIELSAQFLADFCNSPYYCERPLFADTLNVLHSLKKKGLKLYTLSAAGNPAKKREWLEGLFINIFESFEFAKVGLPKDEALEYVLKKHAMNKEETVFVDDRIYNVKAGIRVGVNVVRMQPEFYLPLPRELGGVVVCQNLSEFEKHVEELNSIC